MKFHLIFSIFVSMISTCFTNNIKKEEFTPWYTGPLLTPSANCLTLGKANYQPYIFIKDTHPLHSMGHHHPVVKDTITVNQSNFVQIGLANPFDITFSFQETYNHKDNVNTFQYGDTNISLGIQLLREKKDTAIPSLRLCIAETLPTGKYQHLNPKKLSLDSIGAGAYTTHITLVYSKTIFVSKIHPINIRVAPGVSLPSKVHVENFNAYGGGYNTNGKVTPPIIFSPKCSVEYSITQNWVFASDLIYSYSSGSSFKGIIGTKEDGSLASNETNPSHIVSLAPAIEYNFTKNLGIITGFWFPIITKNSEDFLNYVFSLTYTF